MQAKLLEPSVVRQYETAFLATVGSLQRPLRRQNIKAFLSDLLPRYIVTDAHVCMFVGLISAKPTDDFLVWDAILAYLRISLDPEMSEVESTAAGGPLDEGDDTRLLLWYGKHIYHSTSQRS
jgi:hypothetical protein